MKASIKKHFDDQRGRAGTCAIKRQLHRVEEVDVSRRRINGLVESERMQANLVCDTLRMTIAQRQPGSGLTVHSDRGAQYASKAFQALLDEYGYQCSMSRKGNCWDDAVANRKRCHSTIDYLSPLDYEAEYQKAA